MSYPLSLVVSALLAYVIGATPFGFLAGRMKGIDIRDHGSGNIGATNVLRILGKPFGVAVFILEVLKGAVPVLLGRWIGGEAIAETAENRETLMAVASAVTTKEIVPTPRSWAEQRYKNIVYWNELKKGGHFAAFEQLQVSNLSFAFTVL